MRNRRAAAVLALRLSETSLSQLAPSRRALWNSERAVGWRRALLVGVFLGSWSSTLFAQSGARSLSEALPQGNAGASGVVVSPSSARGGLRLQQVEGGVELFSCEAPCESSESARLRVQIPAEAQKEPLKTEIWPAPSGALLHLRWGGERAYHLVVRGALREGQPAGTQLGVPEVILKGWAGGESATWVQVQGEGAARKLYVGRYQAEALCGRGIVSEVRRYDVERGQWVETWLPAWSAAERKGARLLVPAPGAAASNEASEQQVSLRKQSVRPLAGSSVAASLWTDGETQRGQGTAWAQMSFQVPAEARRLVLSLEPREGDSGSGQKNVWLQVGENLHRVPIPAESAQVVLPLPKGEQPEERCVVLSQDAESAAWSEVFVEVESSTEPESLGQWVQRLQEPERRLEAEAVLVAQGELGVQAVREQVRLLSAVGQEASLALAQIWPRQWAVPLLVELFLFGEAQVQAAAEEELRRSAGKGELVMGSAVWETQSAELPPVSKLRLLQLLVELEPEVGLPALVSSLDQPSAAQRRQMRELLRSAVKQPEGAERLRELWASKERRSRVVERELLRALVEQSEEFRPLALRSWQVLLGGEEPLTFEEAYLLLEPWLLWGALQPELQKLSHKWLWGSAASAWSQVEQAAWAVRLAEYLTDREVPPALLVQARPWALRQLAHPSMRVRGAAARFWGERSAGEQAARLVELLAQDEWPLVREESARALGRSAQRTPLNEESVEGLVRALRKDTSPRVRRMVARALGSVGGAESLEALRRAFGRDDAWGVRAEAALALGRLCDEKLVDEWTDWALRLTQGFGQEDQAQVGYAALTALVLTQPKDLERRVAPLQASSVPGPLRAQVQRILEQTKTECSPR